MVLTIGKKHLALIAIICVVAICMVGCKPKTVNFDLSKINKDEYTFNGLQWGKSIKETQKDINFELGEPFAKDAPSPQGMRDIFMPEQNISLLGANGKGSFEFIEDKLTSVMISFNTDNAGKPLDELFNEVISELTKTIGAETDKKENTSDQKGKNITATIYRWNIENDKDSFISLQVSKQAIDDVAGAVNVGIGVFPNPKEE